MALELDSCHFSENHEATVTSVTFSSNIILLIVCPLNTTMVGSSRRAWSHASCDPLWVSIWEVFQSASFPLQSGLHHNQKPKSLIVYVLLYVSFPFNWQIKNLWLYFFYFLESKTNTSIHIYWIRSSLQDWNPKYCRINYTVLAIITDIGGVSKYYTSKQNTSLNA